MKFNKFYFKPNNGYVMENDNMFDVFLSVICTAVLWIIGLVFVFDSWFTVTEGERAILTTFGKASNHIYEAGLHVKLPLIQDVKTFDVKTIRADFKTETYTKDIQTARMIEHSYPVSVTNFQMINIDYSDQFESAIEKKVVAEQAALEEANRTKQIEQKAKQQIVQSEVEANAIRIKVILCRF